MYLVQRSARTLAVNGIAAGIVGGIAFAVVEMVLSVAVGDTVSKPLQATGSILLGPQALSADYPLGTAIMVGGGLHMVFSALYGVAFVLLLAATQQLGALSPVVILEGVVYAMALWVINFLVIAPALFSHLAGVSSFWLSFTVAHGFYGLALGGYLLKGAVRQAQAGTR
jgi:hypothetical protein